MPNPARVPSVQLDPGTPSVSIDFACIDRIETATGMGMLELSSVISSYSVLPAEEMAKPEAQRRKPTAEEIERSTKRIKLGLVTKVVAACMDIPHDRLSDRVPAKKLIEYFSKLMAGVGEVIKELNEDDEPHPSDAQAPASKSESGPASSSASPATSSGG